MKIRFNNRDTLFLVVSVFIAGALVLLKDSFRENPSSFVKSGTESHIHSGDSEESGFLNLLAFKAEEGGIMGGDSSGFDGEEGEQVPSTGLEFSDPWKIKMIESKEKMESALKLSGLQIALPRDLIFDSIDSPLDPPLDEQSLVLHGINMDGTVGLTMIAARMLPSEKEAMEFIQESPQSFPHIGEKKVVWANEPQRVPFRSESGLKTGSLWRGEDAEGNVYAAVLVQRKDEAGSYLFVQNGPKDFMDENDGYWDQIHEKVKAGPIRAQ